MIEFLCLNNWKIKNKIENVKNYKISWAHEVPLLTIQSLLKLNLHLLFLIFLIINFKVTAHKGPKKIILNSSTQL